MDIRLETLHQAGIIDKQTLLYLRNIVIKLKGIGIEENSDDMQRMITHFAMAISRQQKCEVAYEMEDFLYEEVKKDKYYKESLRLWEDIQIDIPVEFNENEKKFMILHLCTLINNK